MLDDRLLVGLIVLQGGLLAWRLLALGSSLTDPRLPRLRVRDALPDRDPRGARRSATGLRGVRDEHGARERGRGLRQWTGHGGRVASRRGTSTPTAPASLAPGATPSPTPDRGRRLPTPTPPCRGSTSCCIGVDSGVGRNTMLTDTMIVASLDRVAGTVSHAVLPPRPRGRAAPGRPATSPASSTRSWRTRATIRCVPRVERRRPRRPAGRDERDDGSRDRLLRAGEPRRLRDRHRHAWAASRSTSPTRSAIRPTTSTASPVASPSRRAATS